ncbi:MULTISPECIES: hypothetical protein [unclassified Sphingomonas]|uniref:hypothetical protein n=1 Tax=unclassified Sphingomonas TaxID=196159 RepID=UPI002150EBAA|nr:MULTISPECIES: hypothetical protein [unclassified Sphingomonas]MCR5871502.1 hypothetical protein [Sphingomonas sp. J344]UUY00203.1 hypothetical protein LRS08_03495 [Sphingomonas sp. J315]
MTHQGGVTMAKAKDGAKAKKSKTAKASKAAKAPKLPKTVAGIELPKELREQGAKLLELTKHPLVADIVAAGLVALAGNVRKKAADAQSAPAPTPAASDAPKPSGMDDFARNASSLATLIAARAAEKITARLAGEKPPEAPKAPEAPAAPAAEAPPAPPKNPAAPKKPALKATAAKKPAAAKPAAAKPAAAKPAATKKPAAKPAAKAPAKPRAPRAAKPKTPPA